MNAIKLSAMQRLWLLTLWLKQELNCDKRHHMQVTTSFFAQCAGIHRLQQTQRQQVYDLVKLEWLEIVPETAHQKQKYYRLTEWAEKQLQKVTTFDNRNASRVPREIQKTGIQPTLLDVPQPDLSDISTSGEFDSEADTWEAFWDAKAL